MKDSVDDILKAKILIKEKGRAFNTEVVEEKVIQAMFQNIEKNVRVFTLGAEGGGKAIAQNILKL
eukprot:snap_masked-scaffold_3-processed-gene-0.20-mRNA-1 protein AED:1.00 eAED:1.00 QI:0/0/0/0/1/1/2/0/64